MRKAAKSLLNFQSLSMDTRTLFKEVNDAAIQQRAASIPAGSPGGSYQQAWSEMWKEADKSYLDAEVMKRIDIYE